MNCTICTPIFKILDLPMLLFISPKWINPFSHARFTSVLTYRTGP